MKASLIAATCAASLLVGCAEQASDETSAEAGVQSDYLELMQGFAVRYMTERPEMASYYGMSDADAGAPLSARLSHYDPASDTGRRVMLEKLLADIQALDTSDLSSRQQQSQQIVQFNLEGALEPARVVDYGIVAGEYGSWFLPYAVNHLSGPHVEMRSVLEEKAAVNTVADAEGYAARLREWPRVVEGLVAKLAHDRDLGVVAPDFVLDNTMQGLEDQLAGDPAGHSLVTTFEKKINASEIADKAPLIDAVKLAVKDHYFPATETLLAALQDLRPAASHDVGAFRLPNGEAFYRAMIRHMTDTDLEPETIHQLGLDEVARIHGEMDVLLEQIGMSEGTVGERMQVLLNDPKYIYEDSEAGRAQLIADMRADLDKINVLMPEWFGKLADEPVAIKAIPKAREATGCGACYDLPSEESGTPGTFWINLKTIEANPSYSLQTLTYHETNPGHHFQTILGLSDELPLLSTVFYSNAAGEGWGLYSESLAAEMGVYEGDPVDDLGRLQAELHRAVRLVVDTGMHAFGWSRERAIDYSIATEGIHPSEATYEIERYAIWPGQALGYKLGQLKILELREKAKAALGDRFDVRAFHDRVLEDGTLPLAMLEDKINAWMSEVEQEGV